MAGKVSKSRPKKIAGRVAGKQATTKKASTAKRRLTPEEKVSEAIENAIENIQGKLATNEVKPSVADLVRLLQLRKELNGDRPMDVTVRWVEEWNDKPSNGQ